MIYLLLHLQINVLQTKKKFEILDAVSERRDGSFAALALSANIVSCPSSQMLSFMHAQHALFQQGYSLLDDIRPYMTKLAAQVRPCPLLATPRRLAFLSFHLCAITSSAGPAGDRLCGGEERDGAQTRHRAAEGESSPPIRTWDVSCSQSEAAH